ncbi:MAG: hypothetical protein GWP08_11260 [Nitrospiraceae bacterium]|nr:hypothetical protein [Nitrospiraceae bacterium]
MTARSATLFLVVLVGAVCAAASDPIERIAEFPAAPWSLTTGDVDGDGTQEIIYGAIDNGLYVYAKGSSRRLADIGGYAFDVVCLDVDGDGADEIACVVADWPSHVYCFKADGTLLWKREATLCYTAMQKGRNAGGEFLAATDLAGGVDILSPSGDVLQTWKSYQVEGETKRLPALSAVTCADLDGDGSDEIIVGGYRGGVWALNERAEQVWFHATFVDSGSHEGWSTQIPKPVTTGGREYYIDLQRGGLFARNLRSADIDGDGDPEILGGFFRSELMVIDHRGETVWRKVLNYDVVDHMLDYIHMDQRGVFKDSLAKSQPFFDFVDAPDGKGKWIVALQGREDILETSTYFGATDIFVLDGEGKQLVRDVRDASPFRIAALDGQTVYVSTGMDEADLLRVDVHALVSGGKSRYRHRKLTPAAQNWVDLDQALESTPPLPPTPGTPDKKIKVIVLYDHAMYDSYFFSHEALKHNILALHKHFNSGRDGRIEYVFRVNLQEVPSDRPDTRVGLQTHEEVLDFVDFCEDNQIPTILWLAHQADECLRPETIIEISNRAPNYFRGVMQVETGAMHHPLYTRFWKLTNQFLPTLAHNGHKLFLHSTGPYWSRALAADPELLGEAVKRYGQAIVPIIKLNNSQAAEYELGACLALWKAGHIKEWGYSSIDHWTFTNLCRMNAWKRTSHMGTVPMVGLGLGAEYILYYPPILRVDRDEAGMIRRIEERYPPLAHMSVIEQLIEKNMLEPVTVDQAASLSPLLFQSRRLPNERSETNNGILEKTVHFQQCQPNNVSAYGYGIGIGSSGVVPKTPYGIFGIVPKYLGLGALDGAVQAFDTDHHVLYENDAPLGIDGSVAFLKKTLAETQEKVPFHTPDAFCGVQQLDEGHWRLFLVDPGHLRQLGVSTDIQAAPRLHIARVTDRVSGTELEHTKQTIPVGIKPGLFRILDVVTATQE